MSDDFGLSSDDEAELLATSEDITSGKHGRGIHDIREPPKKRVKFNGPTKTTVSPSTKLANDVLRGCFGLNGFRLEQEAAITRILDGGSTVVVFPTGGGKSLCYQVCVSSHRVYSFSNLVRCPPCASVTKMNKLNVAHLRTKALASSYRLSLRS
jgi:hypothetical protein